MTFMKKSKIWTVICAVFLLLQLAAEVFAAIVIQRMNVLPGKFLVAFYGVLGFFALLTALLMFLRGKKGVGVGRRIFAIILAVLVVAGCGVAAFAVNQAYKALNTVTDHPEQSTSVRNMYIFVRVEDPAQTVKDTAGYAYAIVADYDTEHTQKAIALISQETGSQLNVSQYEKTSDLADKLYAGEADALLLNGAAVAVLMEDEAYEDFTEKARILHTFALSDLEEPKPTETQPQETEPVELDITDKPFVVYLSGSDTRSNKLLVSRSDVNILVVVNPVTKQILMINTPRDYYVPNPAGNGKMDKLTHCGLYGTECSMEALSDLYDLQVDYYAQINFTGFETLVDAVGGVTVYSDQAFNVKETYFQKGENHLNGEQALTFARDRYHVNGGDNGRGKNQMKVIKAVIEKMTTSTAVISNYSGILQSLSGMFKTSVAMDDVSKLVKMQLDDMASWNIQTYAVTGTGGSEKTYSMPGSYAYVMHKNEASVNHASDLAQRVIAGETLTEADMKLPQQ